MVYTGEKRERVNPMLAYIQKAVAWIVGIILAILGFLGIYKKPVKPVDPPTTSVSESATNDPFETPIVDL